MIGALGGVGLLWAGEAGARQGVAVLPFTGGAHARPVEELVLRHLSRREDVRLVPPARWRGEMRRHPRRKDAVEEDDFVAGARDLNLRAALSGHVARLAGRRRLFVDLLDPEGTLLRELAYDLPEEGAVPKLVLASLEADLPDAVSAALRGRQVAAADIVPLSFPHAVAPQATDTEDPFAQRPAPAPAAPPPPPRPALEVLRVSAGALLSGRQLRFSPDGRPGMGPAVAGGASVDAWVYPLVGVAPSLSWLGVHGALGALGWGELRGSDGTGFPRQEARYQADLHARVPLPRGFALGASFGGGAHVFTVRDPAQRAFAPEQDPVPPATDYRYLNLGLDARLPLWERGETGVIAEVRGGYRVLLGAGDVAEPGQYGAITRASGGGSGEVGISVRHRGLLFAASGFLQGYRLTFQGPEGAAKRAEEATDLYYGGALRIGVSR